MLSEIPVIFLKVLNKGKIHKVPASDMEALKSPLMGLFEKRRAMGFFKYVQNYVPGMSGCPTTITRYKPWDVMEIKCISLYTGKAYALQATD